MRSPLVYVRSYREVLKLGEATHLKASHLPDEPDISDAQRLHAKIYLHRKYVVPEDVGSDGRLHLKSDPYQEHSKYFAVHNHAVLGKPVVATARQIMAHPERGHNSFPTVKELELYPEMKEAIMSLDPSTCVEISGLAKDHGVSSAAPMVLYRKLWHHSLQEGHHVWIMACDVKAYKRLEFLFGDAFVRIGPNAFYMGSEVVPAMLEVHRSIDPLVKGAKSRNPFKRKMKRELVKFFMDGLTLPFHEITQASVASAAASRRIVKAAEAKKA